MLYDGIQLTEGSNITNMVVAIGDEFPSSPDSGELFYATGAGAPGAGFYVYDGATWQISVPQGGIPPADWANITNKPTEFVPAAHGTHVPAPGADGQVLTLASGEPIWAASAGGGGGGSEGTWAVISSGSWSTPVATVDIPLPFNTYTDVQIMFEAVPTGISSLQGQFSTDGGSSFISTAIYKWAVSRYLATSGVTHGAQGNSGTSAMDFSPSSSGEANSTWSLRCRFRKSIFHTASSNWQTVGFFDMLRTEATGFSIAPAATAGIVGGGVQSPTHIRLYFPSVNMSSGRYTILARNAI